MEDTSPVASFIEKNKRHVAYCKVLIHARQGDMQKREEIFRRLPVLNPALLVAVAIMCSLGQQARRQCMKCISVEDALESLNK